MSYRRLAQCALIAVVLITMPACLKIIPGKKPAAVAKEPVPPPPPPRPVPVTLTLQASQTVNPNASNRPSPVVVRVYQLRNDVAFRAVSYDRLYDDDQGALGKDLVEKSATTLRPGDQMALTILLPGEVQFLGIVAFYREGESTQWKVVIPAPKGDGTILVDKSSVSFSAK